jgi:hypothetical protein
MGHTQLSGLLLLLLPAGRLLLPAGRLLLLQGPFRSTDAPAQSASQALL